MTNEELLQQAKDKVAKAHPDKYENWDALVAAHADSHSWVAVTELQDIAACLAIQSAREEWYPTETENHKELPEPGEEVLLHSERAKYYVVGHWDQEDQIWRSNDGPHLTANQVTGKN